MQDSSSPATGVGPCAPPQSGDLDESRVGPSASRMLTNYLADVEQNLDEHRWDLALRDVLDLPAIAVALTNPQMSSTADECRAWCARWVRPSHAANDYFIDHEYVSRVLEQKS